MCFRGACLNHSVDYNTPTTPSPLCFWVLVFAKQKLNRRLLVSNDFFVRTTCEMHHECSRKLWKRCSDQGDIYLGRWFGDMILQFAASLFVLMRLGLAVVQCAAAVYLLPPPTFLLA